MMHVIVKYKDACKSKIIFNMFNCNNYIENAHIKVNKISLLKSVNNAKNNYLNK